MASNITPGTQQYCEIEGARGISLRLAEVGSITQDALTSLSTVVLLLNLSTPLLHLAVVKSRLINYG